MPKINLSLLIWARETAGLTVQEASKKLGIQPTKALTAEEIVASLEIGTTEPSRAMLKRMAKKYHRSLLAFYLDAPPKQSNRGQDFRTLPPSSRIPENLALVDALIRDVLVRQSLVRSAVEDDPEYEKLNFVGSMKTSDGVAQVAKSIKRTIKFELKDFYKQSTTAKAFSYLRAKIEAAGVIVLLIGDLGSHHTALDLDVFRGFALSDEIAPFIVANDHDARSAWSFTLMHELTHVLLGQTGVSGSNYGLEIEVFCNRVAGELLLPESELQKIILTNGLNFETTIGEVSKFASARNISATMVAYNLYLSGRLSNQMWLGLSTEYRRLWMENKKERREKEKEKERRLPYYIIRRHRLGKGLLSLVRQMVIGGSLTTTKASRVLGVAPKNYQNLFAAFNPNVT